MHHLPTLTLIAFLALGGAAFAGAPAPHAAWATGKIARVDGAAHALVVKEGNKEVTFALAPSAKLTQGSKTLAPTDLGNDVGQAVKVRYSMDNGSRLADLVQVAPAQTPHQKVTKAAKKGTRPAA